MTCQKTLTQAVAFERRKHLEISQVSSRLFCGKSASSWVKLLCWDDIKDIRVSFYKSCTLQAEGDHPDSVFMLCWHVSGVTAEASYPQREEEEEGWHLGVFVMSSDCTGGASVSFSGTKFFCPCECKMTPLESIIPSLPFTHIIQVKMMLPWLCSQQVSKWLCSAQYGYCCGDCSFGGCSSYCSGQKGRVWTNSQLRAGERTATSEGTEKMTLEKQNKFWEWLLLLPSWKAALSVGRKD